MRMGGDVSLATLLPSLSLGFPTFSHMNWPRDSMFRLSVVGLLGIVSAVLAVREGKLPMLTSFPWSSCRPNRNTSNKTEKSFWVPGLQNLQNNCFLNVVLQALASCFCFQTFLDSVTREFGNKDSMPLAVALASLLEELSLVTETKVILSPRKVMLALSHYIPNFNLTSQQDAAEAFSHLLCSLREEFEDCYTPTMSSLTDIFASNHRILASIERDWQSEQERWQQLFLGPFDGILGSILTCQSCSSQISMTFESFDCLPLSPLLNSGASITVGCTLVDCLKQFIVAEHVESYRCSHCWHNAAIKYLSSMEGNETEIEKLNRCSDQDFCDCEKLYALEKLPWSNKFSCTLKQLSIARCPRILCIQLKRVSMNIFGEPVKLQGHISFPLILDVSPFMTTRLGIKLQEVALQRLPVGLQNNRSNLLPNHYNLLHERRTLDDTYQAERLQTGLGDFINDEFLPTANVQSLLGDTVLPCIGSSSGSIHTNTPMQPTDQVDVSTELVSQETCLFQLVSAVEHFGRAGSGHYTVYRRMRMESSEDNSEDQSNNTTMCWFCVSDSQVQAVKEEDVLSAEASLLFYERIPKN